VVRTKDEVAAIYQSHGPINKTNNTKICKTKSIKNIEEQQEQQKRKKKGKRAQDTFGLIDGLNEMGLSPRAIAMGWHTHLTTRTPFLCMWIALNKWPMTHNKNYYE